MNVFVKVLILLAGIMLIVVAVLFNNWVNKQNNKRKNIERKIEYGFVPVIRFIALGIALLLSALYLFFKK